LLLQSHAESENTLTLLKLLALGNQEIAQGRFLDAEDFFAAFDVANSRPQ